MDADNQTPTESSQHDEFNVREAADNINDGIKFVDNANTVRNVAQGLAAGGAWAGVVATGGAGMMAGLAAIGGSAIGGIGVLGIAPTAAAKMVMNQVLVDDDRLSTEERDARAVGRAATTVGAVVGTAAPVVAISTLGSVAGLSGAGITSVTLRASGNSECCI
jgi:hypothetical protein